MSEYEKGLYYLRTYLNDSQATFRNGQWDSIQAILNSEKLLVVQRTGWGKSIVYFIASRLLIERKPGLTLIVSPLLSLMRNQISSAKEIGLEPAFITSDNDEEWPKITEDLADDTSNVLFIAPERFANKYFNDEIFPLISSKIHLLVIDEAHCISDWGHDFRPDYRRIGRILNFLPSGIPVLATTATANNRVVDDICNQIGNLKVIRGSLHRESLFLVSLNLMDYSERLSWLSVNIPNLPGSGIVYTLTILDTEIIATWLKENGIEAEAYHSDLSKEIKIDIEERLIENKIKTIIATTALGMGYDKPDLGFVIHFQKPRSIVHYYQQVGRAGRSIDKAYGILMCGQEDEEINDFFINQAFPTQQNVKLILDALQNSETSLSISDLQKVINLKRSKIEGAVKYLECENLSPIYKETKSGNRYSATPTAKNYTVNISEIEQITEIRKKELIDMESYSRTKSCLQQFISNILDDTNEQPCGKCINCNSSFYHFLKPSASEISKASEYLKNRQVILQPKKTWVNYKFQNLPITQNSVSKSIQPGRALSIWGDQSWSKLVKESKYSNKMFGDDLVQASKNVISKWKELPIHDLWITSVPSMTSTSLIVDFSKRLANELGIPYLPVIKKVKRNSLQKEMHNTFQQLKNLDGTFDIDTTFPISGNCLIIDDIYDSGWTITVLSSILVYHGVENVFPFVLSRQRK